MNAEINFKVLFCLNKKCEYYGDSSRIKLCKNGHTKKGTPRYLCHHCNRTFTDTLGTIFYKCHYPPEFIIECLALLAERCSLAAIERVKKVRQKTLLNWLEKA